MSFFKTGDSSVLAVDTSKDIKKSECKDNYKLENDKKDKKYDENNKK